MLSTDLVLSFFAACNSVRVLAYLPQIVSLARDQSGAKAVSCLTWSLFSISNLSTALYACVVVQDAGMTAVFTANTACCALIVVIAAFKRRRGTPSGPGQAAAAADRPASAFRSLFDPSNSSFLETARERRAQHLRTMLAAGTDWLRSLACKSCGLVLAVRLG